MSVYLNQCEFLHVLLELCLHACLRVALIVGVMASRKRQSMERKKEEGGDRMRKKKKVVIG